MFYAVPDASKVALVHLAGALRENGFTFIDCQQETANLLRFGAKAVPREAFMQLLDEALEKPTRQGSWAEWSPSLSYSRKV